MARQKGLHFYKRKKKISPVLIREVIFWLLEIALTIFLAFCLVYFLGMKTSMIGVSMEPELYNGQEVFVDRFSYGLFSPKRGDVIVFLPNGNEKSHYYIKRVVATPGEKIQIRDGQIWINGEILEEEKDFEKIADPGIAKNEITLNNGEFFVLGDNRNISEDSRSANIGVISKDVILGKAWFHKTSKNKGMGFIR